MYYESTRNRNEKKKFSEVLLSGLAKDGGLYIPKKWIKFSNKDFIKFKKMSYEEIAFYISKTFIGEEIKKGRKILPMKFILYGNEAIKFL